MKRNALTVTSLFAVALLHAAAPSTVLAEERAYIRSVDMPHVLIDRPQAAAFREDVVEFELAPAKSPGWRLEYKVTVNAGDAFVYSLTATGPVTSEFHNEMLPRGSVMFYREETATTASHGQFVSPANGQHGWYIANTVNEPVKVRLKLSGYYTVDPGVITFKN